MKLYLSGGGSLRQNLYAYNSYFNTIDKSKPILYIPLAMESDKYKDCYNWFKKEIGYFNFTNFEMVKSSLALSKLDLNNYSILCHFNKSNFDLNKNFLKEYSKSNKLIFLPEEDVFVVTDKKINFIGNKKYCLFYKGEFFIHNSSNLKKDINFE